MKPNNSIALIPARGGSKSIPLKNLARVGKRSLIDIAITNAIHAGIQKVYVSTDSQKIMNKALASGAKIITRPSELSSDISPTELTVLDAISKLDIDSETKIILIQATSPFTKVNDIKLALNALEKGTSLFSAVESHNFLWEFSDNSWIPINHDKKNRLMKEQMNSRVLETGNFYCFNATDFLEDKTRFCKISKPYLIAPITNFQIDSKEDLKLANKIIKLLV